MRSVPRIITLELIGVVTRTVRDSVPLALRSRNGDLGGCLPTLASIYSESRVNLILLGDDLDLVFS